MIIIYLFYILTQDSLVVKKNMDQNFLVYNLWHPIFCTLMLLSSLSQVVCPSASGIARDGPGQTSFLLYQL